MPTNSWFKTREGAEYARVSLPTLRRAIKSGRLKAFKLGHIVRLRPEDIDNWLMNKETTS